MGLVSPRRGLSRVDAKKGAVATPPELAKVNATPPPKALPDKRKGERERTWLRSRTHEKKSALVLIAACNISQNGA
jgi:hypothetical protein